MGKITGETVNRVNIDSVCFPGAGRTVVFCLLTRVYCGAIILLEREAQRKRKTHTVSTDFAKVRVFNHMQQCECSLAIAAVNGINAVQIVVVPFFYFYAIAAEL